MTEFILQPPDNLKNLSQTFALTKCLFVSLQKNKTFSESILFLGHLISLYLILASNSYPGREIKHPRLFFFFFSITLPMDRSPSRNPSRMLCGAINKEIFSYLSHGTLVLIL